MEKSSKTTKQRFVGIVLSNKMKDTAVVAVTVKKRHPKYHKTYSVTKRFKVHNPENQYQEADKVEIEACRPISKEKKFIIVKKV